MKAWVLLLVLGVALPVALGLTLQEDDLVFDDLGEDSGPVPINTQQHEDEVGTDHRKEHQTRENNKGLERLWGLPNSVIAVGHIYKLRIPKNAFSSSVDRYEVHGAGASHLLPRWLYWDEPAATLSGVPSKKDIGSHRVTVKAFGKHGGTAKDTLTIQVLGEKNEEVKHKDGKTHCGDGQEQTILTVVLDAKYENLAPTVKVNAIENLAGFLGMHASAFSLHPYGVKDMTNPDVSIILKGPGNVKRRKEKHWSAIQWQVGCDGTFWHHQTELVKQLREQAKDGTLAEVLQLPVLLWRVKTDENSFLRNRREAGSGDFADDYEDAYDDNYDDNYGDDDLDEGPVEDDEEDVTSKPPVSPSFVPNGNEGRDNNEARENNEAEHRHRHRHGQGSLDWNMEIDEKDIIPIDQVVLENSLNATTIRAPVTPTEQPTTTWKVSTTTTTENSGLPVNETKATTTTASYRPYTMPPYVHNTSTIPPYTRPSTTTKMTTTTSYRPYTMPPYVYNMTTRQPDTTTPWTTPTEQPNATTTAPTTFTTFYPTTSTTTRTTTTSTTTQSTTKSTTTERVPPTTPPTTTTTTATTTTRRIPTTTTPRPTVPTTTEITDYGIRNSPPRQDRRLKKLQVTAGKPLSYVIPPDTFSDFEDGDTRKLKLSLYWQGAPIKTNHWLQFNSHSQEVYGLPLESDVSAWNYELIAADSEGLNVTDRLDIHVQQHKLSRSVNHEFSVYLKVDKWSAFGNDVEWELKVVRSLADLYGDFDDRHITVRSVDIDRDNKTNTQAIFTWSNDSLPRSNECPTHHINRLLRVLVSDKSGDPSQSLIRALEPEIRVKRVVYQGIGQCEGQLRPVAPEVHQVPTQEPRQNFPPVPRNQVDRVNATVGQLLVYKVPEDTFFDAEDGSSRNMKMSLLTVDRLPIPSEEWLQFDSKNQEFYGIPLSGDAGRKEYQLVVTDKDGATATDGLVVVVHPTLPMQHTVEFSMTLDIPYESFANSAFQKRNFIEKLRLLYGDRDTSAISLESISEGSTVITWYNRTLPTAYCANEEINRLRSVLVKSDNDQRSVTDRVGEVMGPSFPVKMITVIPMGICLGELTGVHSPDHYVPPIDDSTSIGTFHDDYLLTFVLPAIIIAAMLILAGIIACVLYRRRRVGKMSVSEQDDERQSFRSKGIPVIFQDELEEKPDPGDKAPVILKEEKPPLPPPEYQKIEDGADVPMLSKANSEEPYQPPPPFATNRESNRQNRPKPTPTYRKPPPYVPP
ncbi:dystroglycan 1 isoform X2 [Prorops nasuta]|uniref:dystroglycan 1 isoform X2 n=1 Tax=Prorops nasuta TaxID=863751 RepID=UPI0034CD400B